MLQLSYLLALGALSSVLAAPAAVPAPHPTPAAQLNKRASCTFSGSTGASLVSKSKASCATIVISAVAVPSGVTLDLTDLTSGTHVRKILPSSNKFRRDFP
jgi:polygalacturonase